MAVRLWAIIKAMRPGHWQTPRQVITYRQNGSTQTHTVPTRYWGTVRTDAHVSALIVPADYQAQCVKPDNARYLRYYHG